MSKLTPVTFTKSWRGYSAGETAGFTAEQAQALIDADTATAAKPGKQAAKQAQPATKASDPAPVSSAAVEPADDEKP
jgi:hypothetical protein